MQRPNKRHGKRKQKRKTLWRGGEYSICVERATGGKEELKMLKNGKPYIPKPLP